MKLLFSILSSFFILTANAQNGGQSSENNYGKLVYSGYLDGQYVLVITNKQECGVDFNISWLQKDTTIFIPSGDKVIKLPGGYIGNIKIKAKPLYKCGSSGGDMGQLEVTTPVSLPVIFKSINTTRISGTEFYVNFSIADPVNVNRYVIQRSDDGIHWVDVMLLWPDQKTHHSIKINLLNK